MKTTESPRERIDRRVDATGFQTVTRKRRGEDKGPGNTGVGTEVTDVLYECRRGRVRTFT